MAKSDRRALYEMKLTTGMAYIYGPEGKEAHARAMEEDVDKTYRVVVNIVGKVKQGKTSLRRLLIGEPFNDNEESTVGIEAELVETLGTSPNPASFWPKIDIRKANEQECDLVVGKHVRDRLNKKKGNKYIAQIISFLKAVVLTYLMVCIYFKAAEMPALKGLPWFPVMLTITFLISGLFLFDSLRDGFGMAVGTLCLVLYIDSALRWDLFQTWSSDYSQSCFGFTKTFFFFALIHAVMALFMGFSTALGFCFILCVYEPPWSKDVLDHEVLLDSLLHVFVLTVLVGIWTFRYPTLVGITVLCIGSAVPLVPTDYMYCVVSGLGCGYSHVLFIKIGFDIYVSIINPALKRITSTRIWRRCICYVVGILPGFYIVNVLQWERSECILLKACFGLMFIFAIEACHKVLEGKVEAAPKATMKNPTKVINPNADEATLKFVIRDFAGHPLYHSVHHVYMMGNCIYVIVFSLLDAKKNFKMCSAEILYWLQAVQLHDKFPSVRCLIIGTHRDDPSLSVNDRGDICERIQQCLPRQFHNMLIWNKITQKPVFLVENSVRYAHDADHVNLRSQLLDVSNDESFKPKYPIKYLYFFRVINQCREAGRLIETLDRIEELCGEEDIALDGDGQLEDLLKFFHESGEIIYNAYDNNQNQMVVLDPKALVDIMVSLVRAPPRSERDVKFMSDWQTLEDLGIASRALLSHILKNSPLISAQVNEQTVIDLLQYLDLICKLHLGTHGCDVHGRECYLLTPLLKDTLPYKQNYWQDAKTDTIMHVDFGPVVPKFIFTRLVCQCASRTRIDIGSDGSYHLNASTSKALFQHMDTHSYKLELQNVTENETPSQQLLKIVIRGVDQDESFQFASRLCSMIYNIVERDFRKCRYKIGIMCPFEGSHDYCQYEEKHIFSLFESIQTDIVGVHLPPRIYIAPEKVFWCKGRRVTFRKGHVTAEREHNRILTTIERQHSSWWTINVLDLPSRLYSDICDDLNLPNALGRNWKGLAGEFGKTAREVAMFQTRNPRDPCDALLQDWAGSTEGATVEVLVEKLTRLGRVDVVRRLEELAHHQ